MKFKTTPYHSDLLKDTDRLASFYNAIMEYGGNTELAYDLGCGSGILSYFLSSYFEEIIALELDFKAAKCAKENLSDYAKKFLKEDGQIIPGEIINTVEIVNLQRDNVHWDEDGAKYEVLSDAEVYSKFNLLDDINPNFEKEISIKSKKDAFVNGLKITTFTKLNDNIICGPTPMLNPPLLIPMEKRFVKGNDFINVKLKYIMGNGIESIQTEYL